MADNSENKDLHPAPDVDEERRSFLKTSVYAAYATPVITALLVEDANAALSCKGYIESYCSNPSNYCRRACLRICDTICLE